MLTWALNGPSTLLRSAEKTNHRQMSEVRRRLRLRDRWRLAVRDPRARELVDGCEAFLTGQYVVHRRVNRAPVPVWAWTNLLAHATEVELRSAHRVRGGRADRGHGRSWAVAQRVAIDEVLLAAERGGGLTAVQQATLIPLEQRLVSLYGVATWSPNRWLVEIHSALDPPRERNDHDHGPDGSDSSCTNN